MLTLPLSACGTEGMGKLVTRSTYFTHTAHNRLTSRPLCISQIPDTFALVQHKVSSSSDRCCITAPCTVALLPAQWQQQQHLTVCWPRKSDDTACNRKLTVIHQATPGDTPEATRTRRYYRDVHVQGLCYYDEPTDMRTASIAYDRCNKKIG